MTCMHLKMQGPSPNQCNMVKSPAGGDPTRVIGIGLHPDGGLGSSGLALGIYTVAKVDGTTTKRWIRKGPC